MGSSTLPVQNRTWVFSVESAAPHPECFHSNSQNITDWLQFLLAIFCRINFQNFIHTLALLQPECYQLKSSGCTELRGGCEADHFRQPCTITEKPSRLQWKAGLGRWTGSWAQADTFQLNCLRCSSDCPKAICPSLHSFNCLLMLSTCLLSCPQSRTQLAQLPAHAPPCLEIKQLLLSWVWVTLHFTSQLRTNSCRRSDRPQDSGVEGKEHPR